MIAIRTPFPTCVLLAIALIFFGAGCAEQSGGDWYDQTIEHNRQRDEYITDMVDSGLTAEEARDLHDRRVWEMNTINMAREGRGPEDFE